jgi:HNH endonuclease
MLDTPCILWTGSINPDGYGRLGDVFIHRLAWEREHGPVPTGLELDHLCRMRHCRNVDHLEPVTHRVNMQRGDNAQRTHCIHGHPFEGRNLVVCHRPDGRITRTCRECNRLAVARYSLRHRNKT